MRCCRKWLMLVAAGALGSFGCEPAPPPVSFSTDVQPVIARYCVDCHQPGGAGYEASGLDVGSYAALMKGTNFGPVIVAGDAFSSNLIILAEGRADSSIKMPHEGPGLKPDEIEMLKSWIDEGALDN